MPESGAAANFAESWEFASLLRGRGKHEFGWGVARAVVLTDFTVLTLDAKHVLLRRLNVKIVHHVIDVSLVVQFYLLEILYKLRGQLDIGWHSAHEVIVCMVVANLTEKVTCTRSLAGKTASLSLPVHKGISQSANELFPHPLILHDC